MTSRLLVDKIEGKTTSGKIQMPSGHILQTLSSTKLDQQGISTSDYTDLTDLSVTITPFFSSSKILITAHVYASWTDSGMLRLMRDSTRIPNNTQGDSEVRRGFALVRHGANNEGNTYSVQHLDAPATTSATVYKIQASRESGSGTMEINRRYVNNIYSLVSSITVQEIAQ